MRERTEIGNGWNDRKEEEEGKKNKHIKAGEMSTVSPRSEVVKHRGQPATSQFRSLIFKDGYPMASTLQC